MVACQWLRFSKVACQWLFVFNGCMSMVVGFQWLGVNKRWEWLVVECKRWLNVKNGWVHWLLDGGCGFSMVALVAGQWLYVVNGCVWFNGCRSMVEGFRWLYVNGWVCSTSEKEINKHPTLVTVVKNISIQLRFDGAISCANLDHLKQTQHKQNKKWQQWLSKLNILWKTDLIWSIFWLSARHGQWCNGAMVQWLLLKGQETKVFRWTVQYQTKLNKLCRRLYSRNHVSDTTSSRELTKWQWLR